MKHPVGLSAGCPPRRSLFQIPLEKFDAVPSFLWAFWVLFGLPGHFLLLTFVRADLGKRAVLWVDTGLQEPHRTQKWRKLAGLQGRAPPSTQRPLAQQLWGTPAHGRQSPDQDWHWEPMIQGILPLGWGVSVPLRKNFQSETWSELSGLMSCHQKYVKTKYFLGWQRENSSFCLPTLMNAVIWHCLTAVSMKRR